MSIPTSVRLPGGLGKAAEAVGCMPIVADLLDFDLLPGVVDTAAKALGGGSTAW